MSKILKTNFFGIYEKALPQGDIISKIKNASKFGFDFLEMSIDESDARLARLELTNKEIEEILLVCKQNDIFIRSICFSGQRRFPLGSHEENTRQKSLELLEKCIKLAFKLNVRTIQLAGYDVFYEKKDEQTRKWFIENLNKSLAIANKYGVNLSIEIMDDPFINSISNYLVIKKECQSPWLSVYPDLGNLSAWKNKTVIEELELGFHEIVGLHIKDTYEVTKEHKGAFKNVKFGEGCVDFEKIFKYLLEKKYTGSFLIEAWCEDFENPKQLLTEAKEYVLNIFKKVGWDLN